MTRLKTSFYRKYIKKILKGLVRPVKTLISANTDSMYANNHRLRIIRIILFVYSAIITVIAIK